ncbi:nitronate monooxygenase [Alisedimentitalea sp. MJ-SS2]|uniref:NAD(P)H-dependent flavin oxidoreductase n=1 Tax=Aliisedimentitalea sp. MJ-SS2 TaxID=3049795 RepID=UPI00290ED8AC|nr:nitronate monooxygenase [Alisedimentitalea sp. MJ-SS2]MDU8929019.1 nitronate monooxygenase [Alisedimentitalea sp. MJ-SS2]
MVDYAPISTRLTERFGLDAPIVSAPMAFAAGGALAAAVSRAGALGFIGGGYGDADWLEAQWQEAGNQPVGCGFITWKMAQSPELLTLALDRKPAAMFLSFGELRPHAEQVKAAGVPLFAQVQTLAMARDAVAAGADVIVAQGSEAGGHGATRATMTLVPEVVDACADKALVLAAGGIADGRGLAAALMLGADGVLMGTRFWAAGEALVAPGFHDAALMADGDGTLRSSLPDKARGYDWPGEFDIRTLRNRWIKRWQEDPVGPVSPDAQEGFAKAVADGDADGAPAIVGEGIGLISAVMPASEIVVQTMAQAKAALARW